MKPGALLISAYNAASHAAWAAGVRRECTAFDWRAVNMPPRHFAWRIRGSGLALLQPAYRHALVPRPDVLLVTSMLDLSTARAVVPALRNCPAVVYFHENQFAYPSTRRDQNDVQLITVKTALAGDRVVFNSVFNRDSFFSGAAELLAKMPDAVAPDLLTRIQERCAVVPVPLDDEIFLLRPGRDASRPLSIVWNHRWEYDKGVDRLVLALRALKDHHIAFELHVCGQQFRRRPPEFAEIESEFGAQLVTFGYIPDRAAYLQLLASSDVVVSTAIHEFQGLAVLEAVAAGCIPLVPDRLAYPEWIPGSFLYTSEPRQAEREALALADRLAQLAHAKQAGQLPDVPQVHALRWSRLVGVYNQILHECLAPGRDD